MTDKEFLRRVELMEQATEGLRSDSRDTIMVNAMHELINLYFKGKKEISRSVYERIEKYLRNVMLITKGEVVLSKCNEASEAHNKHLAELRKNMLHVGGRELVICASLNMCRNYIREDIWRSSAFKMFFKEWEKKRNFYDSTKTFSGYDHYYMDSKDFLEFSGQTYRRIFEVVKEASYKYYQAEGYFSAKGRRDAIFLTYEKLPADAKKKVVEIRGCWQKIERTEIVDTYRIAVIDL